ncbi:Ig-like domain-containing protein [Archangium violaceum]|uniref:adventurous gliding motility protein AgmC n=1 Tax=Archangium violaceum TaxID=83451 RepID=UPI002B31DB1F|nr:Ig-like domain-containing protein [Archangium gephyra]
MLVKNLLVKILTTGVLLAALVARAEPDRFHLGTGRDGALVVSGSDTVVNRHALVKAPIAPGDTAIQVEQAEGIAAGDLVMVLQSTGLVPSAIPGDGTPVDLSHDPVGRWELARVFSVEGDILYLSDRLLYSYAAQVTQVIRVPEFTTVDIRPGAKILAQPWNGATGGIIAFLATGSITNEGAIDASGSGFRGGSYVLQVPSRSCSSPSAWLARGARRGEGVDSTEPGRGSGRANIANGGGGGACMPSGGGGGGHGGPGGQGGQPAEGPRDVGGMGGARLAYSLMDRLMLGGGGGGGSGWNAQYAPDSNGGRGGGAIFIRADNVVGKGLIAARGEPGHDSGMEGAGGGGAGGSISVRVAGALQCASLDAVGGHGGRNGGRGTLAAGGGGGGGQVLYQATWVGECSMSAAASLAGASREPSGAQPTFATLSTHAGTISRLEGGLTRPGAATLLTPADGSRVDTRTPTITGTAPVGLEVVIYLDGLEVGRTMAEGGFFEWRVTQPLTEGLHHVQVAASHQGLQGEPGLPHLFVVSTQRRSPVVGGGIVMFAASTPTLTSIADLPYSAGMRINVLNPRISGAVTAVSPGCDSVDVEIRDGATLLEPAITGSCNASGVWSVVPGVTLTAGAEKTYSLTLIARKGMSTSTATGSFVVDTVALAPIITAPTNGAYIKGAKPRISGTTEGLGSIEVVIDGDVLPTVFTSSATADSSGAWSFSPTADLAVGFHWVRARVKDQAGNISPWSNVSTFTVVNTSPLGATIVTSPGASSFVNTATPIIRGTADYGSTVTVTIDGTAMLTTVSPNASRDWTFTGTPTLSEGGPHTVQATARDSAGNTTASATSAVISFTVDLTPPDTNITTTTVAPRNNATSLSISFSSETGASFMCSTNGVAFSVCVSPYSYTGMTNGNTYHFYVRATDRAGNVDPTPAHVSWISDQAAPGAPVFTSPGDNVFTNDTTPEIRGTAEAGSTVTLYDNTTALLPSVVTNSSSQWVFVPGSALGSGLHNLMARATDEAGNTSADSLLLQINIDTLAPETVINTNPPNPDSATGSQFTFSSSAADLFGFECSLDGADFSACASPYTLPALATGLHTFKVRAVDSAGNRDATPASYTWLFDNSRVETFITSYPSGLSNLDRVSFTFSSNKPSANFRCRHYKTTDEDRPPLDDCTSPYSISGLSSGDYRFEVHAVDGSAFDDEGADYEWTIDSTPPNMPVIVVPGPGAILKASTIVVSGTAEPNSAVTVLVGVIRGSVTADSSGAWSVPVSGVSDGTHIIKATAQDLAGNDSVPTPEFPDNSRSIVVDTAPPITVLNARPAAYTNSNTATFTFSVDPSTNETSVSYTCKLDASGAEVSCGSSWTVPSTGVLSEGAHTIYVYATDAAGNRDVTPVEYTWVVDTVDPETFVDLRPSSRTGFETVYFAFRSSETPMRFRCKLDSGVEKECLTAHSETITPPSGSAAPETHTLVVWAYDQAGNVDETPQSITWTLDKNIPTVEIRTSPANPTNVARASFEFASSKSDATFECLLTDTDPRGDEGAIWPGCTNPFSFFVSDGTHTLWVRARDTLGNVTSADGYVSWRWRVDTAPPDTVIDEHPAPWTQETTGSFKLRAPGEESSYTLRCTLNSVPPLDAECPELFTTPILTDGNYTLTVTARDQAGNVDPTPATYSWTVDTLPPAAPEVTSPAPGAILAGGTLAFSGTAEPLSTVAVLDGTREIGSTTVSETGTWHLDVTATLGDGAYQFEVITRDRALNQSTSPTLLPVFFDGTSPESLFLSGPEERQRIRTREVTFRVGASEAASLQCSLDGQEAFACGTESFTCGQDGAAPCGAELSFKDLSEGDHDLLVTATDVAGNKERQSKVRRWRVYLGGDSKALGGGLSCAAGGTDAPSLFLLVFGGLAALVRRKRRGMAFSRVQSRSFEE